MLSEVSGKTLRLLHRGRESGRCYEVTIWFVRVDGSLYIGALDDRRAWVRNLRANGEAVIDDAAAPIRCRCFAVEDADTLTLFRLAVRDKYPIVSRVMALFGRRGRRQAVFRLEEAE